MVYKELYFSVLPAVLSEALLQEQPGHHWLSRANCTHLCYKDLQRCHLSYKFRMKAKSLQWAASSCRLYPSYFSDPVSYSFPFALCTAATLTSLLFLEIRLAVILRSLHYLFLLLRRAPPSPKSHLSLLKCDLLKEVFMTILLKIATQPKPTPGIPDPSYHDLLFLFFP